LTVPKGLLQAGLSPSDLTVYNGYVFFAGSDTSGAVGLWVTDGTASGTKELTGIVGAATIGQGIGPPGLDPFDLTVFNGQIIFSGDDAHGQTGLWETNGTASGTKELTGIAGAATTGVGLEPSFLTVFNGHVLFNGLDSSSQFGLWETDGTASGTKELTGIAGAAGTGLAPFDLTVLNGQVLFGGRDSSGQLGLWETDGTVAGTHELTGIAGALTKGSGLDPYDLTVYNGEALFTGYDSSGKLGLWETNGTAAGTHEVTGVVGASTSGFYPSDLTAIATTPVVTAGASASYVAGAAPVALDAGLSLADAAAASLSAATVSISAGFVQGDVLSVASPQTGITSQYNAATGVLTLSGAASLAAYKTELDSVAYASPHAITSSRTITWSVNDGVNTSNPVTSSLAVSVPHPDTDVSGPGLNIMLQNTGGQLALWQMNGAALSAASLLGPNPGPSWFEMGAGAFFSGDTSDILLQNTDGAVAVWQEQAATLLSSDLVASPGPNWRIKGTGDFNNDGLTDVLLQNANGNVAVWEMNGSGHISQSGAVADPGPNWHVEATGDFNNDGKSDIVLQNNNGAVGIWEMNGDQITQAGVVANPGPSWHVVGTGGGSDILFQNTSGQVSIWDMNGTNIVGGGPISPNPGSTWRAVGLT
jgi:ELWxxDGT repeat protein